MLWLQSLYCLVKRLFKYVRVLNLDWSWMTVTLCMVHYPKRFFQSAESIKLVGETVQLPNFKTHRSRTWDLMQALDTVQRKNQRDQISNQRIFLRMVYILNLARRKAV